LDGGEYNAWSEIAGASGLLVPERQEELTVGRPLPGVLHLAWRRRRRRRGRAFAICHQREFLPGGARRGQSGGTQAAIVRTAQAMFADAERKLDLRLGGEELPHGFAGPLKSAFADVDIQSKVGPQEIGDGLSRPFAARLLEGK
jgi:hypothetical protein